MASGGNRVTMNFNGFTFDEHPKREGVDAMWRCQISPGVRVSLFKRRIGWNVLVSVIVGRGTVRTQCEASSLDSAWDEAIAQLRIISPLAADVWDESCEVYK